MRDEKVEQLEAELRQAGANAAEISDLSMLAFNLNKLKKYQVKNQDTSSKKQFHFRLLRPYIAGALLLAIIALPIILAQSAQPTSWLFPVQKLSDSVAVSIHPQYRANVMMHRSEQVNSLVANHASDKVILATLDDYTTQAKTYEKMPNTSYAAFEYCETNLKQAAAIAPPDIKKAIHASLNSLAS